MRPVDFHSDCPKCGGGIPSLSQHYYCWRTHNERCSTWRIYGGEHLHRTCYDCNYIFSVLTRDFSRTQEEVDEEWLNKKVDEVIASNSLTEETGFVLFADDIDWEENQSSERPDLP